MTLTYNRYEEIKSIVVDTLKMGNIANVPICCFQLVQALEIDCIPYSSLSPKQQSVCLEFSDEGFTLDDTIYYNDTQIDTRIRFTIMHEIGHIVLGHTEEDELSESEANFFAKYILVPPVLVYAIDTAGNVSEDEIRHIFNVSHPVAEYAVDYYNKWTSHINFGLAEVDIAIYNHFYRNQAM